MFVGNVLAIESCRPMRFQPHIKFYKEYTVGTNEVKVLSDTTKPFCYKLRSSDRLLLQMTKQLTLLLRIRKRKKKQKMIIKKQKNKANRHKSRAS